MTFLILWHNVLEEDDAERSDQDLSVTASHQSSIGLYIISLLNSCDVVCEDESCQV